MTAEAYRFGRLLRKDLESYRVFVLVLITAISAWDLFLWTKLTRWHPGLVFGLLFVPFTLVVFWSLLSPFLRLRQEWDGNHVHLILALPVRGFYVTGAKAMATLIESTVLSFAVVAGIVVVGSRPFNMLVGNISEHISTWDIVWVGIQGLVLLWALLCVAIMLIQFSYLSGRLYERLSGMITVWVLLISVWVVSRLGQYAEPAFRWLPDFSFKSWNNINGMVFVERVTMSSAPAASIFVSALILFGIGSWLLEKQIEI